MTEAGKAAALVAQIATPTRDVTVKLADGTETKIPVAQLTIMDWRDIKNDVGMDMWATLLGIYSKAETMTDEEKEEAGESLLSEFDHKLQLAMYQRGLKYWAPDITPEQANHIISYGIEDQGELLTGLFFMLQGTAAEEIADAAKEEQPGNASGGEATKEDAADTTSEEGESDGEASASSLGDGTDSPPGTLNV